MTAPLIPREILFGNPERSSPKVSPDGTRLAFLAPDEGVLNVWLCDALDPARARALTRDRGRGIRSYFWAEDGSLVFLQDKDGDENWHLHRADPASASTRDLTPHPGVQAHIVATDPSFPDELLVSMNLRDRRLHDVYRLRLSGGEPELVAENPGDVVGWLPDREFRVRAAKAALPDGGGELRVLEEGRWRALLSWGPDDSGGAYAFTPDGRGLVVETSLGSDTTRLVEFDIASGRQKELSRHPEVDVSTVMLHPVTYALEAVAYEADRLLWEVVDPALAGDFEVLGAQTDGDFHVVSRDDADRLWVVLYSSDVDPARWFLYDRGARRLSFLFTARPALAGRALARMEPVSFPARDGLKLRGYLTLPVGVEPAGLPLVLLVHGGPWVRDRWGFHAEAQWLANRGYAVLQVNYRGSMGYGKRFLHAGDREWGARMQDDLTDAARWAVARGFADAERIAVYGGSYGGYAALAGAAFTPDLYACAVDIVGPSNLITLIKSIPPYWEPMKRVFDLRVGDADKEPDFLKSRSPLFSADRIKIPLLIAQGANDPRVKQAESEMIVDALKAKGKAVEYLLFPDEGHGFARPENRLRFYEKAEAFLERHLKGSGASARAASRPSAS